MTPPESESADRRPDWWAVPAAVAWAGLLAWTVWYAAANARNMPFQDEWDFIPVLFGGEDQAAWVVAPHNQHRYFLGRVIYLALHRVTGNWFPAGVVVSIALMAASAFLLTRVARRSRGRFHPADAWYSVLLLNPAHFETLMMGYQLVFTLTTATLALVLTAAVLSRDRRPSAAVLTGSVLLVPLVLGGGLGLTFFAPVGAWVGYLALRSARVDGLRRTAVAFLPAALSLALGVWFALDILSRPQRDMAFGLSDTLSHASEFLAVGFGPNGVVLWPPVRWLISAAEVGVAVWLAVVALRDPAERPVALGLLSVLLGVLMTAVFTGHVRPFGFESRYAAVSCLGGCASVLAVNRYARLRPGIARFGGLVGLIVAACVCRLNAEAAQLFAWMYQVRYTALKADIRDGVPVGFIADRIGYYPSGYQAANFRRLRDAGFRTLAGVANDPPLESVVVTLPRGCAIPPRCDLPPPGRFVSAVRIHFHADGREFWQRFVLHWTSADGTRRSQEIFPWLTQGDWTFSFWVTDRPTELFLVASDPTPGITINAVEYFVPAGPAGK